MPFQEPIRILSDSHFGHPASLAGSPADLVPLLKGFPTVVFNGDTVEYRFRKDRELALQNIEAVKQVCEEQNTTPVFINGNHDPAVSQCNHLDLADGAVLVTHGDMLFLDISPWSNEARVMGRAHRLALEEIGEDAFMDFEKRLHASKRASLALELHESTLPRGRLARLVTYLREGWPPWRPLQILKCWAEFPGKAALLAHTFRPHARLILIGHSHYGGIWRRGPRIVINTGSFLPIAGRTVADLEGSRLTVRKIVVRGGRFGTGKTVATFDATKLQPGE